MLEQEVTKAIQWIYQSYTSLPSSLKQGYDRDVRHPEWARRLLDLCGSPDVSMYNIAVTGSKGKGTHAILLAAILQRAGFRVGLFTSPHLVDFLERFRLNGRPMDERSFVTLANEVRQMTTTLSVPTDQYLGPVGLLTVIACLWFRMVHTDVNIFELGRGARHDDVNQVYHQGVVLAPIFDEHMDKLGPTFTHVVAEKLGVITAETEWLVSNRQLDDTLSQMRACVANSSVIVANYPNHFSACVRRESATIQCIRTVCEGVILEAFVDDHVAPYAENVATALQAYYRVERDIGANAAKDRYTVDLTGLRLPGRLQLIERPGDPVCLIDGSIHAMNASIVVDWIRRSQRQTEHTWALLSLPDDKDGLGVIDEIGPYVDHIWLTTSSNRHLSYVRDWSHHARRHVSDVRIVEDVDMAVSQLMANVASDDLALFLGTQSFVGDVLRILSIPTQSIWT